MSNAKKPKRLKDLTNSQKITLAAAVIGGLCTVIAACIGISIPFIEWRLNDSPNQNSSATANPIRVETRLDYEPFFTGDIYLGEPKIKENYLEQVYGTTYLSNIEISELLSPANIRTCENYGAAILELGITNTSKDEQIRFENTPAIRIIDLKPIKFSDTVHVVYETSSGTGQFHEYWIELRQSELQKGQILKANYDDPQNLPDFFTLQPGEQEWLKIYINCMEPGEYEIQTGINYSYQGNQDIIWSDDGITLTSPNEFYSWHRQIMPYPEYSLDSLTKWNDLTNKMDRSPATFTQWLVP